MSDLRDFVHRAPPTRRLPAALGRLIHAGIVSGDPDVEQRQVFTNIASYAIALNALSHLLIGVLHDFAGLMPLHLYNAAVIVITLSIHRLHRYGDNLAAIGLCVLIVAGHGFVVFALGYESDLQVYFLLAGFLFFLFGVEKWRTFLVFYVAAFAMLIVTVRLGRPNGFVIPEDVDFREFLSAQALINAMILNGFGIFYVLASLSRARRDLARQVEIADALVDVLLPKAISQRLKSGVTHIADRVESATVVFADLSGFTPAASAVGADELVRYLDGLFSGFDALCQEHGVDKIKTIGDSYMAAGGLSGSVEAGAVAVGHLAFALIEFARRHGGLGGASLPLRIGIHSGPLVAGVIGELRVSYDVWGDTVNIAQRMEFHGEAGRVQVSAAFRALAGDAFAYREPHVVAIKGAGEMPAWFLAPRADPQAKPAEA